MDSGLAVTFTYPVLSFSNTLQCPALILPSVSTLKAAADQSEDVLGGVVGADNLLVHLLHHPVDEALQMVNELLGGVERLSQVSNGITPSLMLGSSDDLVRIVSANDLTIKEKVSGSVITPGASSYIDKRSAQYVLSRCLGSGVVQFRCVRPIFAF